MIRKLILSYKNLALFKKLSIPSLFSLVLGALFTFVIVMQVEDIKKQSIFLEKNLIPSLEYATNNITLLKKFSENFTFAILASEKDMLPTQLQEKIIIQNLNTIEKKLTINTKQIQQNFQLYFKASYHQASQIIKLNEFKNNNNELEHILMLYKNVNIDFITIKKEIKDEIAILTQNIQIHSMQIIYFTLFVILFFTISLTFITYLIYSDFNKRFSSLGNALETLTNKKQKYTKLSLYNDELSLLSQDIDIALQEFENLENEKNKIEQIAQRDPLTSLYNRLFLNNFFKEINEKQQPYAVILLDIDHFKVINDTYGHQVGDSVLVAFAKILESKTRTHDIVVRWGGEEFLVLIQNATLQGAYDTAQKIRIAIENNVFNSIDKVTASFGIALYDGSHEITTVVKNADDALYKAKHNGRNKVEINNN